MRSQLYKQIESVVAGRGQNAFFLLRYLLYIASICYGGAVRLRVSLFDRRILKSGRLPCKVISIGNLTVGGTGKTPMTIYVAELVQKLGYVVAVISRGYKGELEKTGGVVSNGKTILIGPEKAGDEPFMLAGRLKNIPVIVGKNRFEAGMQAVKKFNPDVIVLDDAFQHLKLQRDINLVLLDAKRPFGNSHLLPRGSLREPLSSLSRSHAFIFTRTDIASGFIESFTGINKYILSRPIYRTTHIPHIHKVVDSYKDTTCIDVSKKILLDINMLKGKRVFAFSGIAQNEDFKRSIEKISCNIKGFVGYPDHHSYSDIDLSGLLQSAMAKNVDFILTTEKDYVRIAHKIEWPIKLVVIEIKISFGKDKNSFKTFISGRLKAI